MFKPRPPQFIAYNTTVHSTATYPQCHLAQWYPYQGIVESTLVIVAVLCIPVMLFGKIIWISVCGPRQPRLREPRKAHRVRNLYFFTVDFIELFISVFVFRVFVYN